MTASTSQPVVIDNVRQLSEFVRNCAASQTPAVDYGVFHANMGHPAPVECNPYRQQGDILEHYERDMTVRVAAGAAIGRLNEQLALTKQFCPIDADDDLTVGEALNHNMYGPVRVRYGSVRDLLLGLSYIDGEGEDIHVGGRTVKNVAGLDITRLMVGSMGELGIVHEATLRTYAVPEQVAVITAIVNDPVAISESLTNWMIGDTYPATVRLDHVDGKWELQVGYFGRPTACDVQVNAFCDMAVDRDDMQITNTERTDLASFRAEQQSSRRWRRDATSLVKAIVPPGLTGSLAMSLAISDSWEISALPAHGCIFAGGRLDEQQTAQLDRLVSEFAADAGGVRAWINKPHGAEAIEPFAPAQADWPMLAKLKKTMDPHTIFNPGRFISLEVEAK